MIYEVMRTRRSIRRFTPEIPSKGLVEQLIEGAITAPSAGNKQPWRFIAVTKREVIKRLVIAVREAFDEVVAHLGPDYREKVRAYGEFFTRFHEAPMVLAPMYRDISVLSKLIDSELSEVRRCNLLAMERDSALISVSLALQNLLLVAHALGLGATCMTGPLLAAEAVNEILGVPSSWSVMALVPIGHPDEAPDPTYRKPVHQVLKWIE